MNPTLQAIAATQHGVILRQQALDAGYDDNEIWVLRKTGVWATVRRGAYMEAAVWNALDPVAQHRARTFAVVKQLRAPAIPSHISAAILLGLPVWNVDLSVVHVTRADLHSSRVEGGVKHHAAALDDNDLITTEDGIVVTSPARTAIDVARSTAFEPAVVVADAALASIGNDKELLMANLDQMRDWPGARSAGRVVAFADGLSESVGESRGRVQFQRIGLPKPLLQVEITAPDGTIDRADWLFEEEQTVSEFDGRSKYTKYLRPGETAEDVLWREKRREDRIRDQGYGFTRRVWVELSPSHDREIYERHIAAFRRARRRPPRAA